MKEVIKKFFITLLVLFVFRVGSIIHIPNTISIPSLFTSPSSGLINIMNMVGGASLDTFSIFALGVGPYITSSIIVQLLMVSGIPYFKDLKDEGNKGRTKINKIMKFVSVFIGFVQAFAITAMYEKNYGILIDSSVKGYSFTIICMIAGMCAVMWMADLITMHGIGNGTSMIILAGIIARLPATFRQVFEICQGKTNGNLLFAVYCLIYVLLIILIVLTETSERRIPIQQSNRVVNRTLGDFTYIPLKINSASIMPVIFASAFMSAPLTIIGLFGGDTTELASKLSLTSPIGMIIYGVIIVFFTFLYSHIQVNVDEITENLEKNGTYIPGIRPGKETKDYLNNTLNSITCVGALFLLFIALLPNVISYFTDLNASIALGGTGIIVAVGIILELVNNVKTILKSSNYRVYKRI